MATIASSLVSALCLLAALVPAERRTALAPFAVIDDAGAARDLRAVAAGAPALLLPIFTRCTGTCPMTAVYLKDGLARAGVPFRVIVLSFDGGDTPADLRAFRQRFALPADWIVVASGDGAATRALLDGLDFHFMRSEAGFDHPNQTFVFSPGGVWAATLTGSTFGAADLGAARDRAVEADDPSARRRLAAWLRKPEAWILLACGGIAAALAALLSARGQRGSVKSRPV